MKLTRREKFAIEAMKSLIKKAHNMGDPNVCERISKDACKYADVLIAELDKFEHTRMNVDSENFIKELNKTPLENSKNI